MKAKSIECVSHVLVQDRTATVLEVDKTSFIINRLEGKLSHRFPIC